MRFSYIPKNDLQLHGDKDKDFELRSHAQAGPSSAMLSEPGHILILDMVDNLKGTKSKNTGYVGPRRFGPG
jgi:DEAD/DEAH box helicase domain-containing protein